MAEIPAQQGPPRHPDPRVSLDLLLYQALVELTAGMLAIWHHRPSPRQAHSEGDVVIVGKDVSYRNVMIFVERIRDLEQSRAIGRFVNTSLRGAALA